MIQGQDDLSDLEVKMLEMKLFRAEILHKEYDELQAQMESLRAVSVDIELESCEAMEQDFDRNLWPITC